MATITGLTADRMLAIEAASVISGEVVGDDLILTRQSGSTINAGVVRGAQGIAGPAGSDLAVLAAQSILDIGMVGQIRAGRQLTATDFTAMGLSAPVGLYNLSDLADSSGNGRSLINKGGIPFGIGINGLANTAARFAGSSAQGLYISDTGAADPFRVKTISVGCWFRSAKRATYQALISKYGSDGNSSYWMQVANNHVVQFSLTPDGTVASAKTVLSLSDVCDDRWHFIVGTYDGSVLRIYVDGVHENNAFMSGAIFASSTEPFNIGALNADAATAATFPNFGLIDEAFITADVLSEDQIRNLYCAKVAHTLGAVPKRASINVSRLRKGAALAPGDFPTAPLRLYNFSAGSLNNEGTTANGTAGSSATFLNNGAAVKVSGVDGSLDNAYLFSGAQSLSASDTQLPFGLNPWSLGHWFKTINLVTSAIGYYGNTTCVLHQVTAAGNVESLNFSNVITGPFVADGEWHFIVTTAHNAPIDGVKRKFYVDGKLVNGAISLTSINLGGANSYRVGSGPTGTLPFTGSIDGAFACDYVLTPDEIMTLYIKGTQSLGISPKNPGDHIEQMTATDLLCVFDTVEMQHQIDLAVN